MSKNIDQVFIANPITSNAGTDLMYFGQSPYGAGNDAAMLYSNFKAQFTLNVLTTKGDILAYDTAPDRLAVGSTNGQVLQVNSGAAIGLSWSTATYPTSTTINQILYSSSANVVSGLATANNGVLFTSAGGVPSIGTAPVVAGGTGVTSVTTAPAATSFAGWDANKNLSANSFISGYTTTATAAGATVLTVGSTYQQYFTGTTTQTVTMPVTSTLVLGQQYFINNLSTGVVTVQSSGGNTIQAMSANTTLTLTCILTSGTTAASWNAEYVLDSALTLPLSLANGGTNAALVASNGGIFYSTASAGAILAGTATANQVLLSGSSTTPAWSTATYPATTTINNILFSSAANTISQIAAANSGVLVSSGTGVPSMLAAGTTGQVLQASTAGTPSWSTPTYPSASGSAGVVLRSNGTNNIYSTSTFADTYSASNILYSNGANTVTGLATANGGVLVTSNSGVPSILAGSGTTGTVLQATASGTPAWSTATYPASTTINQILFSSAANVVGGISTANNSILQTNGSGVPSFATSLPSGTTFISTIDQNTSSVTLAVNTQYITDNGASLVTYTLPTTCAIGSIFKIRGSSSGGWKVAQSSGQQIHVGSTASTSGATGSIASSNQWDCVDITCTTANNVFACSGVQGNLTVV